jgi:chromosome partitioning protein
MRTIAIANQKGGVGKTPVAVNLSIGLAMAGRLVLLVDMDPQGNATDAVLGFDTELPASVYNLLMDSKVALEDVVIPTSQAGLSILPSDIDLSGAEVELVSAIGGQTRLATKLYRSSLPYDYIIFDTPPNLGLLTINALAAADEVIIPVSPSSKALKGITLLEHTIERVRENLNRPKLHISGVICTRYGRHNVSRDVVEIVRNRFGEKTFATVLRESVKVEEADSRAQSIYTHAPGSTVAQDFVSFVKEVVSRE